MAYPRWWSIVWIEQAFVRSFVRVSICWCRFHFQFESISMSIKFQKKTNLIDQRIEHSNNQSHIRAQDNTEPICDNKRRQLKIKKNNRDLIYVSRRWTCRLTMKKNVSNFEIFPSQAFAHVDRRWSTFVIMIICRKEEEKTPKRLSD